MARRFTLAIVLGLVFSVASMAADAATPKEAVGFSGTVTGVAKSTRADGLSFVITVSSATADAKRSTVKDTAPMVGKDLTLGTRMPRDKDGKPYPSPEDVAYIKSLKPGDEITILIFAVRADPTVLRMQKPGEPAKTAKAH